MDTWWQTETGGFMITPLPITPLKPGSATKPFFGNEIDVVDESGKSVKTGEEGNLVIKNPWPGMARTIMGDPEQYIDKYWKQYKKQGWYLAGDSAKIDEDGYVWIIGRIDDVLKVSGYRLGSAEIESALVSHPTVTEAAAIGLPDELKGNIIHATVILAQGISGSPELENELKSHVHNEIGPIAKPAFIVFADSLPKTRSGKIMRRVIKAKVLGQDVGDLTTLED
jgi:acetyl-CoA synthetase